MDIIRVRGGRSLKGEVRASGSKNAALPLMAAALLGEGETVLEGVPDLKDIQTMGKVLEGLGARVSFKGDSVSIDGSSMNKSEAPYELVRTMRASTYVLAPLLARLKEAKVSLPGGCAIGERPVDLHLTGLKALGADLRIDHGYIEGSVKAWKAGRTFLQGAKGPSVGATIQVMMAAAFCPGETQIQGAALEPEVVDVADFMNAMGAAVVGAGTVCIKIQGGRPLKGTHYRVMPDRIEAATLLVAGAAGGGPVTVTGCPPNLMESTLLVLEEAGCVVSRGKERVTVTREARLRPVRVRVGPYPLFPTDMQAQVTSLLCVADGTSDVTETIFERRFQHVSELRRMGAQIQILGDCAVVSGVPKLTGAQVMASDLRASASLIIAGLLAEGETEVRRVYHLDRGFERLERKLQALGADVERVSGPKFE